MQLHLYVSIDFIDLNLTGVAYSTIYKLTPSHHKCCLRDNCFIAPPKTVLMDWHFEVLMCEFDELSLHQRIDGPQQSDYELTVWHRTVCPFKFTLNGA